jgi:hypothetical protein
LFLQKKTLGPILFLLYNIFLSITMSDSHVTNWMLLCLWDSNLHKSWTGLVQSRHQNTILSGNIAQHIDLKQLCGVHLFVNIEQTIWTFYQTNKQVKISLITLTPYYKILPDKIVFWCLLCTRPVHDLCRLLSHRHNNIQFVTWLSDIVIDSFLKH